MRTIISDSSCLISLFNAQELEILHGVFGEITITPIIAQEFRLALPPWIVVIPNRAPIQYIYDGIDLDAGEASAISLARELENVILIVDDLEARKVAKSLSIDFMGTIRVVVEAKKLGLIPSVRPVLDRLQQAGFYFTPELERRALSDAGEL